MSPEQTSSLVQELFFTAMLVAMPALVVSLVIGLVVSIFQTVTSIQDQTLSYVPRIILVGLAIIVTLGFTLQQAIAFAQRMMTYAAGAGQ
jgi:flagellar biosynthetic protein FliQ